ncbi:MAG: ribosome-associated translation inhibitor RaiA [Patescibacteria group bacterium]|nr:ribosome-associated translation inhibitor RaiA [Patescibacteria group bacterium]MDE1988541.1 ribosome-associated translation inhibitor RaiA [Patescibacteria group bacterium]MDE2218452.1 ribosome-associated translation inhibitor RaiA [Patescibacteria group bacterium]
MNINIKTSNIELTDVIRDYFNKKAEAFEKLIDKKDESAALNGILSRLTRHHQKGDIFKAEMNLHISGKVFHASSEREDLFAAIDLVKDEILGELRSHKERKIGLIKRSGGKVKRFIRGIYKGY